MNAGGDCLTAHFTTVATLRRNLPSFGLFLCSEHVFADKMEYISYGHMTDVGIVSHGGVEEPVGDKQSLQTPESQKEDEDEDTDTDDGAVGDDGDIHGS